MGTGLTEVIAWVGIHKKDQAQVEPKIRSNLQLFI